jgi:hypothetical protein
MDDPDGIALRFLRARKWNINAAVAMLASCVKWRIERKVDSIVQAGEEGLGKTDQGFTAQLEQGKSFTHGMDRHGRPVVYINVALHRSSEQPQEVQPYFTALTLLTAQQTIEDFIIYTMETVRCLLVPPADKVTIVFSTFLHREAMSADL